MQVEKYFQGTQLKSINYDNEKYYYNFYTNTGFIKPNKGLKIAFRKFYFGLGRKVIHLNNRVMIKKNQYNFKELEQFFTIVKHLKKNQNKFDDNCINKYQPVDGDTVKVIKVEEV